MVCICSDGTDGTYHVTYGHLWDKWLTLTYGTDGAHSLTYGTDGAHSPMGQMVHTHSPMGQMACGEKNLLYIAHA